MLVSSLPFSQLPIADLDFEVWVREGDDVGEAGGLLVKFLKVPDQKWAIGWDLVLEGEKGLAGEGVWDVHFDVVLLFYEAELPGLVYWVDGG